jgi:hypothetical protein
MVSRRAVTAGAAWSVPVIMVAMAAPAAAASANLSATVSGTLTADKVAAQQFGTKHVTFALKLTNTGSSAATVDVLSVVSDGIQGTQQGLPTTVVVPVGSSTVVNFSYDYVGNAATATYTVSYRVSGVVTTAHVRI